MLVQIGCNREKAVYFAIRHEGLVLFQLSHSHLND